MAQRSIKTSDRIRLVYTGDPAFAADATRLATLASIEVERDRDSDAARQALHAADVARTYVAVPSEWTVRLATPHDAAIGATIYVIRPINGPERDEAAVKSRRIVRDDVGSIVQQVWDLEVVECLRTGLMAVEGDPRPLPEFIDTMPRRCRMSVGGAVVLASDLPLDPFAPPASA